MKETLALFFSSLTILGALVSCGTKEDLPPDKPSDNTVAVSGVSINQTSVSLTIGESVTLTANVTPSSATDKNVSWSSSDAGTVSVSNGKVTAVKEGTATITVTAGGKAATCTVTVSKGGFPEGKLPPDNEIWYITSDNKPFPNGVLRSQGSSVIQSDKYSNGVGIFEGAFTYQHSVWRPSENSMMKDNIEVFNAPSRYAIWYKIHKLAYGKTWKGTYEDFVEYDAINRKTSKAAGSPRREYSLATPVVTGRTWDQTVAR